VQSQRLLQLSATEKVTLTLIGPQPARLWGRDGSSIVYIWSRSSRFFH
jgi:hypothetical protein